MASKKDGVVANAKAYAFIPESTGSHRRHACRALGVAAARPVPLKGGTLSCRSHGYQTAPLVWRSGVGQFELRNEGQCRGACDCPEGRLSFLMLTDALWAG